MDGVSGEDERVARQIAMQRDVYASGVPAFGSCWALQIADLPQLTSFVPWHFAWRIRPSCQLGALGYFANFSPKARAV